MSDCLCDFSAVYIVSLIMLSNYIDIGIGILDHCHSPRCPLILANRTVRSTAATLTEDLLSPQSPRYMFYIYEIYVFSGDKEGGRLVCTLVQSVRMNIAKES